MRFNASLKTNILSYIKNWRYMFSMALCFIANYGFFLTHYSISVDNLATDRYYYGGFFLQGRFSATILHHALGFVENTPWIRDLCGLILLCVAAILFCVLFDQYLIFKTHTAKIVFSCSLITSPILVELFGYSIGCMAVGGGLCAVALSLYLTHISKQTKKKRLLIGAALLLTIITSWYESLLIVYIGGVFALHILELTAAQQTISLKRTLLSGLYFALPLAVGVVTEFVMQRLAFLIFDIEKSDLALNNIVWFSESANSFDTFMLEFIRSYVIAGVWYMPIKLLLGCFAIGIGLCIYLCVKKKTFTPILLFIGLFLSNYILIFLRGGDPGYRTCQIFAFFVSFIILLLIHVLENSHCCFHTVLYRGICLFSIYMILLQISSTNYWYYWDNQRYEEEKNVMLQISGTLAEDYDISKPIVFVGEYELSDRIQEHSYVIRHSTQYKVAAKLGNVIGIEAFPWGDSKYATKIPQTIVSSYINWSLNAFSEANTELFHFLEYHGVDYLIQGTDSMYEQACELQKDMPEWPESGSIIDNGNYIIVNF